MKNKRIKMIFRLIAILLLATGSAQAKNVYTEWVASISGSGDAIVTSSITLDEEENVFAVGSFKDSIAVTTLTNGYVKLISQGKTDMFVAKINPAGELIWIKQVGGKENMGSTGTSTDFYQDPFFSIVSDKNGNLYVSGHYYDTVDFDPGSGQEIKGTPISANPFAKIPNGFILSLNKDGEFKWVRTLYGGNNIATDIAIDQEEGKLYVTGHFTDAVDFNNETGVNIIRPTRVGTGSQDVFIAKYDTSGNFIWTKVAGGGTRPITNRSINGGLGIHVGKDGYLYTTGYFRDTISFDTNIPNAYLLSGRAGSSTNEGASMVFVLKSDKDGRYIWAQAMGGMPTTADSRGQAITTDSKGNVYTTGYFQGRASFDPQNRTPIAPRVQPFLSCFISKLDSSGNYVWQKSFERPPGGDFADNGFSIAADEEDNIYVAGYFGNKIYLDPNWGDTSREVFETIFGTNSFVIKLDTGGNYIWGKTFSSALTAGLSSQNRALQVLARSKNVYVSGYFGAITDFNPTGIPDNYPVTAANTFDGYIVKLSCPVDRDTIIIEQCGGEHYEFNDIIYEESGFYTQTYVNRLECDSVIHLNLTVFPFEKPDITIEKFTLSTFKSYSYYQWLKDGQPISGANNSKYDITANGEYQVVVINEHGCVDTSDVYLVTNYGDTEIENIHSPASRIRVYPNPAYDVVYIQSPERVNVQITDIAGKLIKEHANAQSVSLSELAKGMYLLNISNEKGILLKTEKLVKAE